MKFCEYFAPLGEILYVRDAGEKHAVWDGTGLANLGIVVDKHGKMSDLAVYHKTKS